MAIERTSGATGTTKKNGGAGLRRIIAAPTTSTAKSTITASAPYSQSYLENMLKAAAPNIKTVNGVREIQRQQLNIPANYRSVTQEVNNSVRTQPASLSGNSGGDSGGYSVDYNTNYNQSIQNAYEAQLNQLRADQQAQQQALAEQLAAQQRVYEQRLLEQQRAQEQAARNAYDSNSSALLEAYKKRISSLGDNYSSAKAQLASDYDLSRQGINSDRANALQEAYVNKMMNERNLQQKLSAQGIMGGAAESSIAGLLNSYGQARNAIDTTANDNLATLSNSYNSNLASALQKYNDAVASAESENAAYRMQLENDLANRTVGSYSNLYSGLANMDNNYNSAMLSLINSQAGANADLQALAYKQMANNILQQQAAATQSQGRSSMSGGSSKATSQYSKAARTVKNWAENGQTANYMANVLAQQNYSPEEIVQIFAEAGITR